MRVSRLAVGFLFAVLLGLSVFAVVARRTVRIHHATAQSATERFATLRASFPNAVPLFARDASGRLARTPHPMPVADAQIRSLCVLAYHLQSDELVQASVPFWLWEMKANMAQHVLRDTGFDLESIGATAADLRKLGPALILDETNKSGDWLLVWTE